MAVIMDKCTRLGVPIAPDKCDGPTTRITYLGIEVDSWSMELRLPLEKLQRVKEIVREWLERKAGKRRDLESLVGLLQHAAKMVRPGRRFFTAYYSTHGLREEQAPVHQIECRVQIRSAVVEPVLGGLERSWNYTRSSSGRTGDRIRRSWQLGLRSNVRTALAAVAVERKSTAMAYCPEGTPTNTVGVCSMG